MSNSKTSHLRTKFILVLWHFSLTNVFVCDTEGVMKWRIDPGSRVLVFPHYIKQLLRQQRTFLYTKLFSLTSSVSVSPNYSEGLYHQGHSVCQRWVKGFFFLTRLQCLTQTAQQRHVIWFFSSWTTTKRIAREHLISRNSNQKLHHWLTRHGPAVYKVLTWSSCE